MDNDNYCLDLLATDESKYSWLDSSDEERRMVKKLTEYENEERFHLELLVGVLPS